MDHFEFIGNGIQNECFDRKISLLTIPVHTIHKYFRHSDLDGAGFTALFICIFFHDDLPYEAKFRDHAKIYSQISAVDG